MKPNFFLQIKKKAPAATAVSRLTGTVTEVLDGGRLEVEFMEDGQSLGVLTGITTSPTTVIGADVPVFVDTVTGKVVSIGGPLDVDAEAELISTGATGDLILATAEETADNAVAIAEVSGLSAELLEQIETTGEELAQWGEDLDEAQTYIDETVVPALESAQADATGAALEAANALAATFSLVKAGPSDPGHAEGRLWIQTVDGVSTGVKISDGTTWSSFPLFSESLFVIGEDGTVAIRDGAIDAPKIRVSEELWTSMLAVAGDATIGGNLIALDSITAPHIVASEAFSAKVGQFLTVTTDQLVAGDAKIAGSLLADTITGKTLIGGNIVGATIRTAESGVRMSLSTVAGDSSRPGIWLYDSNAYRWTTQIDSEGIPATFFYDASQNLLLKLSEAGAFWKDSSGARCTEIKPDAIRLFNNTPMYFYGASESANYGSFKRANDSAGSGLQLFGGSSSTGYWSALSLLSASDGTKWSTQGIRSRTTTQPANLYIGSTGILATSTSVKESKLDVQDQAPNWGLLDVPYRSWIDKQEMIDAVLGRACVPERRIIGAIAEEMQAKAPELCTTDPDGTLTGIQYERVGVALIPLIRGLLNRIEALEGNPVTHWSGSPVYDDADMLDEIAAYGACPPEEPVMTEPAPPDESEETA